jgi:hypothetical protein
MAKKWSKLSERVRALEDVVAKLLSGGGKAKPKKARRKTAKKAKAKKPVKAAARTGKKKAAKPAKRTKKAVPRPKKPRAVKPEPDLLFQEPPPTMY